MSFSLVVVVVAAYLCGSLSFAVLVSRAMGLEDPRTYGSGNPGATNVLRSGSKKAAIATLLLDAVKGYIPVVLVRQFGEPYGLGNMAVALVALAAFAGHLWPVFFKFKGGKGVATAAGVLLGINPFLGLATLLTWVIVAWYFRYSSLAAIASAAFAPLFYFYGGGIVWPTSRAITLAIMAMSMLLVWRHKDNMSRLLDGTESQLGKKKNQ
ncbi:MAG: glycerol-3-phosphate 1-O-acyltransferase PlsY [Pseudomonadota bacterium]